MGCNKSALALTVFSIFLISIVATPALAADPLTDFINWLTGITGAQTGNETPTSSSSTTTTVATATTSAPTTTMTSSTATTTTSSCPSSVLTALGTGCHMMYTDTDGKTIYCNTGMTRSMKDGDASSRDGCTGPTSSSTTYSGSSTTTLPSTSTPCTIGSAITSLCNCGGWSQNSGYCCSSGTSSTSGMWQSSACGTPTTYSITCSASNPWYCYDSSSCAGAGANWCKSSTASGGNCQSSTCSVCSSTSKWSCYTETDCKGATGSWCTSQYGGTPWCQDGSCPTYTCSKTEPWNCKDETSCKGASAFWCASTGSAYCSSSECPKCSSTQQWNCYTETDCKGATGSWCSPQYGGSSYCSSSACPTYTCSKTEQWNCKSETDCKGAGAYWCLSSGGSPWCSTSECPKCSSTSKYNCYDETSCKGATGSWCAYQSGSGGYCSDSSCPTYTCSSTEPWNCRDETTCKGAGASWCTSQTPMPVSAGGATATASSYTSSGWCSTTCPTCSKESPWNCYTKDACSGTGASWCAGSGGYGWCSTSECPKCSSTSKYNCYTDTECKGASGSWCTSQYGGSGWCQDGSCPTYTCSSKETWNCRTESECKGAGASWCGTWCQTGSCPTCSKSQPWNCYTKETCTGTGANWCTSQTPIAYASSAAYTPAPSGWCQENSCPTYICSKTDPWYCSDQTSCAGAGASWCSGYGGGGGYCSSATCPTYECTKESPWNCDTKEKCATISQSWCTASTGSWCASYCPTCSSTQKYNCFYKDECASAAGNWCGTESAGWCSDQKCPSCSSSNPWNCYDKSSCEGAKGSWCGNWCTAEPCPTCSKSQPWGCYIETDCNANGGNWCGNWCQDGSYPCPSSKGHTEDKKEIFIKPDNCREEKDSRTGYVNYVCEKKTEEKCPTLPTGLKEKCESYGGEFTTKKDERGCEFADCKFNNEFDPEKKFIFKKFDRCPTEAEAKEYTQTCEKAGMRVKYNLEGGCKIPFCLHTEENECEKEINPKLEREIEEKCKKQGLQAIKDFDPRGCPVLNCGEPDYCKKIPRKAYNECENQGGELVVKTDDKGCATFSECVRPGDENVYLEENEKITEVPDETELLSLALRLEELKVTFDKMSKQSKDIAAYYEARGDTQSKKFIRVADMFAAATDKIDEIKTTLRDKLKTLTTSDLEEIKLEVRKIRKVVLRDILFVMLSSKDEVKDIGEGTTEACGTDSACFEKNLRICNRATFTPEGSTITITGLEDSKCLMDATFKSPQGLSFSMKCKLPNYALGFGQNAEKDMLPYCLGDMVDAIKTGKV